MFKRAIAIFAFSVFLVSYTTPVTTQPLPPSPPLDPLPDLIITDLFLNPQRKWIVTITNIGNTPLPLGGGRLMVMVDGSLKGIYSLGSLTHQSILPWLPTSLIRRWKDTSSINIREGEGIQKGETPLESFLLSNGEGSHGALNPVFVEKGTAIIPAASSGVF